MVSWVEPRGVVRAAMGVEAGSRVGIGSRVPGRSLEFLLQTAGRLFPKAGSQLQEVAVGQNGGRRQEHPWGDPGWLLGTESRGKSWAL